MKHQIKHRHTESVLFECDLPNDTPTSLVTRRALEKATAAGTNLVGAHLAGAHLDGAYLDGVHLAGAHLAGDLLAGERPIFQIGPIGSRCDYFTAYLTTDGVKLRTGCFFGTVDEFTAKLFKEHGDNIHAREYRAAIELIQCHTELWPPSAV